MVKKTLVIKSSVISLLTFVLVVGSEMHICSRYVASTCSELVVIVTAYMYEQGA